MEQPGQLADRTFLLQPKGQPGVGAQKEQSGPAAHGGHAQPGQTPGPSLPGDRDGRIPDPLPHHYLDGTLGDSAVRAL